MNKILFWGLLSIVLIQFLSCKNDDIVLATFGNDKIYQSQIDSMIFDEIEKLRQDALKIKISRTLFEEEAGKRKVSIDELRQSEIFHKSKPITDSDIIHFAETNSIDISDSNNIIYIKDQLTQINRRFRFDLFIDSLKKANGIKIIYEFPNSKINNINKLYSHTLGNRDSKINFYIIADYNCPSCKEKYYEIFKICSQFLDKIQLHFVYYSNHISKKALLGESLAKQGKFWETNNCLFELEEVNDSVINAIAAQYQLNSVQLKADIEKKYNEQLLIENQRRIEELKIYSVPAFIIDDEILPGYYNTDKLVQIINYKIINNAN